MKFNWGFGISAIYIGFVLLMLALVGFSFSFDVNLVADNYYEKEIRHQTEIDKQNRYERLPEKIFITLQDSSLLIKFPKIFKKEFVSGQIYFSRDDNSKYDFSIPINLNDSLTQNISLSKVRKGFWRIAVDWRNNSITYLTEKKIMVY
ncbi:MAG: hypothetical protein Fur0015_08390 [Ignavibacteriales bacterium]